MPEELVQALALDAGQLADQLDQLGVASSHARAHNLVVTGGIGLVLEHQVVAVGGEQLLVGEPHRLHRVLTLRWSASLAIVGRRAAEAVGDALKAPLQRREEQLALVREQAEHIRLRHTHTPRDPLHRRAVQTTARELVHGGGDQLLAALGGGNPPAHGLGCGAHAASLASGTRLSSTAMNSATETIPKVQPLLLRDSVIRSPISASANYLLA